MPDLRGLPAIPGWGPTAMAASGLLLGALLTVAVVYWLGLRRGRRKARPAARASATSPTASPAASTTATADKEPVSRGDLIAATIATMVAAEGMWETFNDLEVSVALRIAMFAFIEIMTIQCARRARRSMQDNFSPGADGIAMWVLTCLSATLSVSHELAKPDTNPAIVLVRLIAPLVAAWGWERQMRLERRRRRRRADGINWVPVLERLAVRAGLAEPHERTASDVDVHRRLHAVVHAAHRKRTLQTTGARERKLRRAQARLDKAMAALLEHTGYATDPELQDRLMTMLGAAYHAGSLPELQVRAPWTPGPAAAAELTSGTSAPRPRICVRRLGATLPVREPSGRMRSPRPADEPMSGAARSVLGRVRAQREARSALRAVLDTDTATRPAPAPTPARTYGVHMDGIHMDDVRTDGTAVTARTAAPAVRPEPYGPDAGDLDAPRTANRPPARPPARADDEPVRPEPDGLDEAPVRDQDTARTDAAVPARTGRTQQVTAPVQPTYPDRHAFAQELADRILAWEKAHPGQIWKPEHDDLMAETGWGLSWCQKAVRSARVIVHQTRTDAGAATAASTRTGT